MQTHKNSRKISRYMRNTQLCFLSAAKLESRFIEFTHKLTINLQSDIVFANLLIFLEARLCRLFIKFRLLLDASNIRLDGKLGLF